MINPLSEGRVMKGVLKETPGVNVIEFHAGTCSCETVAYLMWHSLHLEII